MPLTIVERSNPTTLALAGRLDTNTAPELDETLDRVLANTGLTRLVFDLGQLDYLSSAGIRCFVRARKAIEPAGGVGKGGDHLIGHLLGIKRYRFPLCLRLPDLAVQLVGWRAAWPMSPPAANTPADSSSAAAAQIAWRAFMRPPA